MLVVFLILVFYEVVGLTLDSGGGGVYDSPLVTDQLGGRSGVQGLEALQVNNIGWWVINIFRPDKYFFI